MQFEVAAPIATAANVDPLSPTAYLTDLLDFAGRSIAIPQNAAAQISEAANRRLVAVEIGRLFHQRPLEIVLDGDKVGSARVSAVRTGVEVLRRILDPTTRDLVAHWAFDEGAGPSARDSSGNDFTARAIVEPGRPG